MNEDMNISMDPDNLYKEEMYTDRKMGTIRILTPVKSDGSTDSAREVVYIGQAQLMTPMGQLSLPDQTREHSICWAKSSSRPASSRG